jgi:hypothetical protein
MQGWYAEAFEREMGCTVDELLRWLPGAAGGRPVEMHTDGASIAIGEGRLRLGWRVLPPRQIALLRMPRLHVSFDFDKVDADLRQQVMRFFDLFTQRGGG